MRGVKSGHASELFGDVSAHSAQILGVLPQDKVEVVLGVDGVVDVGLGRNG